MTRIVDFLKHNAIALAALFVALGGTSYAAIAIPRDSVGSRQLRNDAVTAAKIRSGAITPAKLARDAFGGEVRYLIQIAAGGVVTASYPKGARTSGWTTGEGGFVVLPRKLPSGCVAIAGQSAWGLGSSGPVGASVVNVTEVQIETNPSVIGVNLEIVCTR